MESLPPPPPGVDLTQSRVGEIIAIAVVCWSLAATAVGLRLVCRHLQGVQLGMDDWLIIISLVVTAPHVFSLDVFAPIRGFGRHIWAAPPDALRIWSICIYISLYSYLVAMMCIKLSVLTFYWRMFKVQRSIKLPIIILYTLVVLWGIANLVVTLVECQPIRALWDRFNPDHPLRPSQYHCGVDQIKFWYAIAIITIITDVMIISLPLPYVVRLQLPRGQKPWVVFIFLVGLFVTAISFFRLKFLFSGVLTKLDLTWEFVNLAIWSCVEVNIAIVCACLPFLRPILDRLTNKLRRLWRLSSGKDRTPASTTSGPNCENVQRGWIQHPYNDARRLEHSYVHASELESRNTENEFPPLPDDDNRSDQSKLANQSIEVAKHICPGPAIEE